MNRTLTARAVGEKGLASAPVLLTGNGWPVLLSISITTGEARELSAELLAAADQVDVALQAAETREASA